LPPHSFYAPSSRLSEQPPLPVVVPFESRSPASMDRLLDLVAEDMQRVNTTILSRTGSQVRSYRRWPTI